MPFIAFENWQPLKNGDRRLYKVAGRKVLLIRLADRYFAVDNQCPHAGAALNKGQLIGSCLRCPKHGILFDLVSGMPQGGDAVEGVPPLRCYPVEMRGEAVGLVLE